ncbi:MAG: B12-binding domain-containing radical SAM protein, partial [Kiritimatiellae bacterium]|nr:B12-binding domain-containing radical SAM protein [Kiritimatiellia bacterium]
MKLCLIAPPTTHMIRTNVPEVVDEVTGCYPPLGLLYVAAAVEESGRHEVCVIDCVAEGLSGSPLAERIATCKPDVVGIQAITFTIIDAYNTARLVKQTLTGVPVVMGGPHVNLYPEETLSLPEVDYLLLGEGERTIGPFLDALAAGREPVDVPGAVFRGRDGTIQRGPQNPLIDNLDSLPLPARHLLDHRRYSSVLGRGKYLTTIMSSRGCPARCIFCDRPHLGKKFRARSAQSVVAEMRQCHEKFGIDEFFFYDDTFTIDRQRVLEICRAVKEAGLDVFWDIRARVSNVDHEMLKALYEAGCRRIHFGIESGNERILKIIRKGVDLHRAREIFTFCRDLGIETLAYFMLGFPEEGPQEIEDTIRYALSLDCDYVHVAVTTPFPGT